ncbi:MAG TPA: hypothetical protein G4N98_01590 [Thermoflexia bacterium]|nr:hypothetical protein [Thermoflexia bacterium]
MNVKRTFYLLVVLTIMLIVAGAPASRAVVPSSLSVLQADDSSPPSETAKLIFIHHSCGGNWLANVDADNEQAGGLGAALMSNNYFVSATNYGWGPGAIGDRTAIPNWPEWFTDTTMNAVYAETGQNIGDFGAWSRLATDPGGENEIIMFKSCYPNSDLYGNPGDPPLDEPNDQYTVANAKAVYNELLTYFETRLDKLFVVITAPPMAEVSYVINDVSTPAADRAANARAFNAWLVNDWLDGYAHDNVALFDFYNVLTSNGSLSRVDDTSTREEPHDYDLRPDGNHHYWNGSEIVHSQTVANNFSAYPYFSEDPATPDPWSDDHPTGPGNIKATAEFVPLLNVFYHRWKSGSTTCEPLTGVGISGSTSGYTNTPYSFTASVSPAAASTPITYTWLPAPSSGTAASASYTWPTIGPRTITVTAKNCGGTTFVGTHTITITIKIGEQYALYLPIILRNYVAVSPCSAPLTGVTISGPTSGVTGTTYTFNVTSAPTNATTPIAYTWTPAPQSGEGTSSASYQWSTSGSQTVQVAASNCSGAHTAGDNHTITIAGASSGDLVQPADFTYRGAFRLPGGDEPPLTFAYGGNAMTCNPHGDSGNGSLFIMGHDRQPYGGLPDGGQIAEISIPAPVASKNLADLNTATFIQDFANVAAGYFTDLEELPRTGMAYLDTPATGPKIHLSWGQHHKPDTPLPTYAWFDPNLSAPDFQGLWFIGHQDYYSLNGYMFEIPASWADAHAGGSYLGTGRAMDGGWGGMGPSLFAYRPWQPDGTPANSGTHLAETPLLLYEDTQVNGDLIQNAIHGHQHPDEWEGGAWLTTAAGKSAVLFASNKGTGAKYWYGYLNPAGPEYPCVNAQAASEFIACRLADGSSCPPADMVECADHTSAKGWWCARFDARFVLYDPADLAQVAAGAMDTWEPQPYAYLDIGEQLFYNPAGVDLGMLGTGIQRRYLFGSVAYDRDNGFLYILENFADEAKPVVHVWQVE